MASTFIIAELSANHNGSLETAEKTILAAAEAGVEVQALTKPFPQFLRT